MNECKECSALEARVDRMERAAIDYVKTINSHAKEIEQLQNLIKKLRPHIAFGQCVQLQRTVADVIEKAQCTPPSPTRTTKNTENKE